MQISIKLSPRLAPFFLIAVCCFSATVTSYAHTINYALEKAPANEVISYYLGLGFKHIIPDGFDHVLFVVGLCLLSNTLKQMLWQATAFTIAHSITLAMSMKGIIVAPTAIVEPIIALSILFVAIENVLLSGFKAGRLLLVFFFGLIHGLGFASSLNEIGLPRNSFLSAVLSFNAGVELGQIVVILAIFLLLVVPFKNKIFYRKLIVYPLSILIAITALYWTVERVFFA